MSITIKELAAISGYSSATISRVLTNKSNVSEKTRQAVQALLLAHNYRPTIFTMQTGASLRRVVLLVVNDITNLFYTALIREIQEELFPHGFLCVVGVSENRSELEEQFLRYAREDRLAGIALLTPIETPQLKELLGKLCCPVVLLNRYIRSMDLDAVCIDNYRGGYLATEYLIQKGHKKICHLAGFRESSASSERQAGFLDAYRDYLLQNGQAHVYSGNLQWESGYAFFREWVERPLGYTAIFFANDLMAAGFCAGAQTHGISIPKQVSVIAFDNTPTSTQGSVKITTVGIAPQIMGQEAAKILLSRMQANGTAPPTKVIFPPTVTERESVRAMPAGNAPGLSV